MKSCNLNFVLPLFLALMLLFGAVQPVQADWDEGDGHKMHYPQLPNPDGWDVCLVCQWLADDFKCSETGPIEDIHFWISWREDMVGEVPDDAWDISIWDDAGGMPGMPLWSLQPGSNIVTRYYGDGPQGWVCPSTPLVARPDHQQYFQVNITDIEEPFIQDEGAVYWLVIKAWIPEFPSPVVGWKTSMSPPFNAPALWSTDPMSFPWIPIAEIEPSIYDLAFVITGGPHHEDMDFGDAPDGAAAPMYPTLLINDGARHIIGGPWLGDDQDAPDPEPDGQPDPAALGDDNDTVYPPPNDDEDGVQIPPLTVGQTATINFEVNSSDGGGGTVSAWIDWDGNGIWGDSVGEQIVAASYPNGTYPVNVIPPLGSVIGQTFARFRITRDSTIIGSPTGLAQDGEVEDYEVIIEEPEEFDFGDAPEEGVAYPSINVFGRFPTCMAAGGPAGWIQHRLRQAYFGPGFDFEPDGNAGLCPGCFPLYDQDECFNDGDAGLIMPESYTIQQGPLGALVVVPCPGAAGTPLGNTCQVAQWGANVDIHVVNNMPVDGYVNVLMDWNQDGKWAGGSTCPDGTTAPEHVLVNFVVPMGFNGPLSGLNPPTFTIGPNVGYVWSRFTITESRISVPVDGWNGEGVFEDGETEDYLLEVEEEPWVPKPHVPNLKWSQPPIEIDPYLNNVPIYCGWDEPSLFPFDDPQQPVMKWKIVADDFRCLGRMPVTSVHWWGSHVDWRSPEPPPMVPIAWRIGFWSNVPAAGVTEYSYPEMLLHQIDVDADKVEVEWAGYDEFPERPTDSCFQYYVKLDPHEYFHQDEYPTQDNVFWISIVAIYPKDIVFIENPWGWKTRPWHWMDDAVTFTLPEEPLPGMGTDPAMIRPLEDDSFGELESYDTAFELDTDPEWVKWDQPFTGFRRWPHYEDEASWATESMSGAIDYRRRVADDWLCRRRTPVTAMVWWGSYIDYRWQACQGEQLPPPRKPDKFELTIWTDMAVDDPCNIYEYSHPRKVVWRYVTRKYDEVLVGFDKHTEGEPGPREPVFRYSVRLPEEGWFCQNGVNNVYWLSVVAIYNEPADIIYPWGWTNHQHVFNDDAVAGQFNPDGEPPWTWRELFDQTGESEDMSFTLFTDPDVCCQCADFVSDGMVDFNDLVIFVTNWLWTGSPGGYNTADLNCDGEVQLLDFAIFSSQWLASCP